MYYIPTDCKYVMMMIFLHFPALNEGLVKYLMERDELHMTQDSMLVDIEDVTRYL